MRTGMFHQFGFQFFFVADAFFCGFFSCIFFFVWLFTLLAFDEDFPWCIFTHCVSQGAQCVAVVKRQSVKLVKWLTMENHLSILESDWALRESNMDENDNVITVTGTFKKFKKSFLLCRNVCKIYLCKIFIMEILMRRVI